ncbi:MAG: DUF348 domain-containing protein [Thermoanaerobacteraceae bacterium]|nr:DUF348 domain-containing protein [Thermoanaerobacteraceae bacterium]
MEWQAVHRFKDKLSGTIHPRKFHLLLLCLCLFLVVGGLVLAGYAWASKKVTLVVDGQEVVVETRARTVGDFLQVQQVQLDPRDRVEPEPATPVTEGMRVVVRRAVPVKVTADGQTLELVTAASTVGEVLRETGIAPGEKDMVQPAPDEQVQPGMTVQVIRVKEEIQEIEVPIPYHTRRESDPELTRGMDRVVQAGSEGREKQRWVLVYHDGQEVKRYMKDRQVITPPVDRVIRVGTLQEVSRGGRNIRFSRALDMVATAYSYGTGSHTATGSRVRFGVAAVDPRVIPLGTRLYVDGYGYATALDVGSAIKGNRIDLFLESEAQARRWGVRRVKVYVLE